MSAQASELILTEQDYERLISLSTALGSKASKFLEGELDRARIVDQTQISSDVVTMHSVVTFYDFQTKEERRVALVYPNNADAKMGRISILAPLGAALIGLRIGDSIRFPLPHGNERTIQITSIDFQPEAFGALDL